MRRWWTIEEAGKGVIWLAYLLFVLVALLVILFPYLET